MVHYSYDLIGKIIKNLTIFSFLFLFSDASVACSSLFKLSIRFWNCKTKHSEFNNASISSLWFMALFKFDILVNYCPYTYMFNQSSPINRRPSIPTYQSASCIICTYRLANWWESSIQYGLGLPPLLLVLTNQIPQSFNSLINICFLIYWFIFLQVLIWRLGNPNTYCISKN